MNDYLMHYGVLGMKWGVRKARKFADKSTKHRIRAGLTPGRDLFEDKRADLYEQAAWRQVADNATARGSGVRKHLYEQNRKELKGDLSDVDKIERSGRKMRALSKMADDGKISYEKATKAGQAYINELNDISANAEKRRTEIANARAYIESHTAMINGAYYGGLIGGTIGAVVDKRRNAKKQ